MNYQQILAIPYVFNLINKLINSPNSHPSNQLEIVTLENIFYIRDSKKNLYLIQDDMKNTNNIKVLLDTFVLFEENKLNPMDIYLKLKNNYNRLSIDHELLKTLQMQYSINKKYFEKKIIVNIL